MATVRSEGDAPELLELVPRWDPAPRNTLFQSAFSSVSAWVAHLDAVKDRGWKGSARGGDPRDEWSGGNWATAVRMAKDGWQEGADRVARLRNLIEASHPTYRHPKKFRPVGTFPNVPRALAGNPNNMHYPFPSKTHRRPIITLLSQFNAIASFGPDLFIRRAAITAAVVDAIETAGFRCHVVTFGGSDGHDGNACTVAVTTKEPDQPADPVKLAFTLGHPAMFRKFGFAGYESYPELRSWSSGYGSSRTQSRPTAEGTYVIPSVQDPGMHRSGAFKSDQAAVDVGLPAVIRALQEQGCPAFDELYHG